MASFPPSMQRLIMELSKLPSVGEKSATRMAYFLLNSNREAAHSIAEAILAALDTVRFCERCFFLSEEPLCTICSNSTRDPSLICVVEKPMDVIAVERLGEYKGLYHVLHGVWAPLRGQGPKDMKLTELIERVKAGCIAEVILATSSTIEGDATSIYVARLIGELGIKCTRLAQGMPKGGELEYADDLTLSRAFSGRGRLNS